MDKSKVIVSRDNLIGRSYEDSIIRNMSRKVLYREMNSDGFNPKILLSDKKITKDQIVILNESLRNIKEKHKINISLSILIIDEDYMNINNVVNLMDERNKQIIYDELSNERGDPNFNIISDIVK